VFFVKFDMEFLKALWLFLFFLYVNDLPPNINILFVTCFTLTYSTSCLLGSMKCMFLYTYNW